MPAGSRVLTMLARFSRGHLGNDDLKSGNAVTPGQVSSLGVPSNLEMSDRPERRRSQRT